MLRLTNKQTIIGAVVLALILSAGILFARWDSKEYTYGYEAIMAREGLSAQECHACMSWAFGDEYDLLLIKEAPAAWNMRHKDIFIMRGEDYYQKDIARIAQICFTLKKLGYADADGKFMQIYIDPQGRPSQSIRPVIDNPFEETEEGEHE